MLDNYGNVTQSEIYNYDNLTTPVVTYTSTYLTGAQYTSRYIFNRLASSTISGGGEADQTSSYYYDAYNGLPICPNFNGYLVNATAYTTQTTMRPTSPAAM